jgi:hypothetical protein
MERIDKAAQQLMDWGFGGAFTPEQWAAIEAVVSGYRQLRKLPPPPAKKPEAEEVCGWCKRSVPVSEMNTLDWGGKGARICDRCCDESA